MNSPWASTGSIWCGGRGGRWRVWRGVRRRGTWRAGTGSSAGAARRGGTTSASSRRPGGSGDRVIGWSGEARRHNIRFLAYNTRFLILPWVAVPHLASHILGRMARQISQDWERVYGHPIYFLETFIDPERFRGTCYRAANWVVWGELRGAAKTIRHIGRIARSKRCWRFHSIACFMSYCRMVSCEAVGTGRRSPNRCLL